MEIYGNRRGWGEFIANGIISTLVNELIYIKSSVSCS